MMRRILLVGLLALGGCATTPVRTGFLDHHEQLAPTKRLDESYVAPDFRSANFSTIAIATKRRLPTVIEEIPLPQLDAYLTNQLAARLQLTGRSTHIVTETNPAPTDNASVLHCTFSITDLDPGSQLLRWLMYAGNTFVQVEGQCLAPGNPAPVLAFAERRRGAGLLHLWGGDSQDLIEQDLKEVAKGFAGYLAEL
jgi:hypothetical protein